MALTIQDLAKMANTSTATVSRVLSNKPGVAEEKRRAILDLAQKVGYSPNRIARNLALKKSHVLGFIAADLRSAVYVDLFRRIQNRVTEMGYQVLIADSQRDVEKERQNIRVMREHRAEGLLIFPVHDWEEETEIDHFLQLKLQKFPFVLVGEISGYGFDFVTNEEVRTARRLTKHLLELGHKRIGFVGMRDNNRCIHERYAGVCEELAAAGLAVDPAHCIHEDEDHPTWTEMLEALKSDTPPTALVFINDTLALKAIRPIMEAGFTVPDDISIVSFGSSTWAEYLKPALTTTIEDLKTVAETSIDLLMKRIEDPNFAPVQEYIPQEVVMRESTAAPRV